MTRECNKTYTDTYNCHIGVVQIKVDECNGKSMCGRDCTFRFYDDRWGDIRCALFNKELSGNDRCDDCIKSSLTSA